MKTNKKTIALYAFVFIIVFCVTTMLPIYLRSKKDAEAQSESQLNSNTVSTESEGVQTDESVEIKESSTPEQELFTGLENIRSLPLNDSNIRTYQKKMQDFLKKKSITEYTNINCIRVFDTDIQKLEVIFYAEINDKAKSLVRVKYNYEKDKFTFKLENRSLNDVLEDLKNKFQTPDTEIGNRPPDMKG